MTRADLDGTGRLVRLALRRDRVQLPIWLVALTATQALSVQSVLDLYPTREELHTFAVSSAKSPVVLATNGLVSGDTAGAVLASQTLLLIAIGAALMSTLLVVRHTRQEEETGRAEMVRAAIVGRYAMLTAALIVALGTNVALGVLNVLVLVGLGLPTGGSVALGAAIAAVGIVFAGVSAVTAQVTEGARAANGLAGASLGLAVLLRALGDVASTITEGGVRVDSSWPSWLSPVGWAEQIRPYDDNAWWVLALLGIAFVVAAGSAYVLSSRRDLAAGLLPTRPGPEAAPRALLSPIGLAWRLQRGLLLGWSVALALLGLSYGAIGNDVDDLVGTSQGTADILTKLGGGTADLVEVWFSAVLGLMAIAVAAYAVQAVLRLHAEESSGRLEPVLATAVSRSRWLLGHLLIVVVGVIVLFVLTGAATGLAYAIVAGDGSQIGRLTAAALVRVPSALLVAGLAVAVFGAVPSVAVGAAWGALAAFLFLAQLGVFLDLPQLVLDLSPFAHVPAAPVAQVTTAPLVWLVVGAILLTTVGTWAFRRRDVPA
jgi:polyether ionophore transport system permease protein